MTNPIEAKVEEAQDELLAPQFRNLEQQGIAARQGMWIFLATETLFFGTLFAAYTMLRFSYPEDFRKASHEMNVMFGSVNTFVLLTSSLFMARAVGASRANRKRPLVGNLLATAFFGTAFLVIKIFEYAFDFRHDSVPGAGMRIAGQPGTQPMHLFMYLYWVMTGFHALHLIIGIGLVLYVAARARYGRVPEEIDSPVEVVGLYWHFIDAVWLFLYPALYLAGVGAK